MNPTPLFLAIVFTISTAASAIARVGACTFQAEVWFEFSLKDKQQTFKSVELDDSSGKPIPFSTTAAPSPQPPDAVVVQVPGKDGTLKPLTGRDAIFYCVIVNDTDHLRLLLAEGHDIKSAIGDQGLTLLHHAAFKGHLKVAEMLLQSGADINARNAMGRTALDIATANGQTEMAKKLRGYAQK